eukprot:scaffold36144_cov72-Phaeocystis_antarctica.AAC.4
MHAARPVGSRGWLFIYYLSPANIKFAFGPCGYRRGKHGTSQEDCISRDSAAASTHTPHAARLTGAPHRPPRPRGQSTRASAAASRQYDKDARLRSFWANGSGGRSSDPILRRVRLLRRLSSNDAPAAPTPAAVALCRAFATTGSSSSAAASESHRCACVRAASFCGDIGRPDCAVAQDVASPIPVATESNSGNDDGAIGGQGGGKGDSVGGSLPSNLRSAASRHPLSAGSGRRAPVPCAAASIERSTLPCNCSNTAARLGRSSGLRVQHCVASCSSGLGQHEGVTPSSSETLPWHRRSIST